MWSVTRVVLVTLATQQAAPATPPTPTPAAPPPPRPPPPLLPALPSVPLAPTPFPTPTPIPSPTPDPQPPSPHSVLLPIPDATPSALPHPMPFPARLPHGPASLPLPLPHTGGDLIVEMALGKVLDVGITEHRPLRIGHILPVRRLELLLTEFHILLRHALAQVLLLVLCQLAALHKAGVLLCTRDKGGRGHFGKEGPQRLVSVDKCDASGGAQRISAPPPSPAMSWHPQQHRQTVISSQ